MLEIYNTGIILCKIIQQTLYISITEPSFIYMYYKLIHAHFRLVTIRANNPTVIFLLVG